MRALAAVEKTAGATSLAQFSEEVAAAARQELVDIALMGDVEHELVFGCAERAVEGDRQFDDAEVGADMTAIFRGHGDELGADFLSELRELGRGEGFDVFRAVDGVQQARVEGGDGCGHRCLVFSGGLEFFEGDLAVFLFLELLDLKLGVLEPCLAHFEQLIAFFKSGEQLGQRHVAGLHRFNDGLEFSEGVLER